MRHFFHALILVTCWLQVLPSGMAQTAQKAAVAPPTPPTKTAPSTVVFDFSPVVMDQDFDGFLSKVVVFKDGPVRRHVTLPTGWIAAGSSGEIYLTNPKIPDARITLRLSSLEAPAKYDEGWIEATKPLILGGLPKDSKEQRILNVTPNVLNVQGWTSIEFKVSFDRIGRRFSTGWLFLTLADRRFLEVVYTGPDDKFPLVRAAAVDMMGGWEIHVMPGKPPGR